MFARSLPIADSDHALHHCMEQVGVAFDAVWGDFKSTLSAAALAFGSYHKLDHFRHMCVDRNSAVPEQLRETFARMFQEVCPQFIETRWQFLYTTLAWLLPRRASLSYLKLSELEDAETWNCCAI